MPYLKKACDVCLFISQAIPNKFVKHPKKRKIILKTDFENGLPILLQQFTKVTNIIVYLLLFTLMSKSIHLKLKDKDQKVKLGIATVSKHYTSRYKDRCNNC